MCTAVAIGLSALGSLMQGYSAQQAAKSQAAAMEQNARIADQQATDTVQRGGREEADIRRNAQRIAGAQRAQAAASGLALDSGSLTDAAIQSATNASRDVAKNAINHAKEAWGYNMQANNYRAQASAARASGRNAMLGGIINAGTSLLALATPNMGGSKTVTADAANNSSSNYYNWLYNSKHDAAAPYGGLDYYNWRYLSMRDSQGAMGAFYNWRYNNRR